MSSVKDKIAGFIGLGVFMVVLLFLAYALWFVMWAVLLTACIVYAVVYIKLKFFTPNPEFNTNQPSKPRRASRTIDQDPS